MPPNFWDQRYAEDAFAYGTEPNDFLRDVAPQLSRGRAIAVAEGQGRNAVFLAQQGLETLAMDMSAVGLQRAEGLAQLKGTRITTQVGDLADWDPGDAAADVVVAIWCHLPSQLRRRVHPAFCRWLRPGGALVLECYRQEQVVLGTGGPKDADLLPTLAELQEDFASLDLRICREVSRDVHEGPYHHGPSATLQVLGFKRS
jgi:SAM-dependent methyltransferase